MLGHRLVSALRWLFARNRAEQVLDEELQTFIDMSAADKVRDGLPPVHARRLACSSSVASSRPRNAYAPAAMAVGSTSSDETSGTAFRMSPANPASPSSSCSR